MARAHADPVCDPVVGVLAGHAEVAADQIGKPAAATFLVVEPYAGPFAGHDDGEAALAAPAPFLAGAECRLAQKLDRQFGHPGAQLDIEGPPVPPAHRCPRRTGACKAVGRRAGAA